MSGITDPSEEFFKDGTWGWDGSAWRKLPMLFGYGEHLAGEISFVDVAAGDYYYHSGDVPAGELWIVQSMDVRCTGSACTLLNLYIYDGDYVSILAEDSAPADGRVLLWSGEVVLSQGCDVRASIVGAALNDDLIFCWWGYKMLIAE